MSPRLRYICDYLSSRGWQPEVYTELGDPIDFAHAYPIHEVTFYRKGRLHEIDWAIKALWTQLTNWKERYFTKQVEHQITGNTYDAVFCTTFSTFPLRTAMTLAEERRIPLFVDIRDLDEQVPDAQYQKHRQWWARPFRQWYKRVNIQRRNHVLRVADRITTISPWHVDFIRQLNPRVHLVYNGYAPETFYPKDVQTQEFLISYIGRIYEFQSLDLIEQAIAEIGNPEIRLNLHTPQHNPLPNHAVTEAIHKSSIMLVLTNPEAKGMMTTKFYEAVGCHKPVLCTPSDKGLLADTIREMHAGLASSDIEEIKAFILEQYATWKQQGYTHQAVINAERFSRRTQTALMEQIMLDELSDTPLVSVIIPVYNVEEYLDECLQSLLAQTYPHWEAILVDDGSTDRSGRIADTYPLIDSRIRVLHQANQGQSAARNRAMELATGTYTVFVDADDRIASDYLEQHLRAIRGCDYVQSGYQRISHDGQTTGTPAVPEGLYQRTVSWARMYRTDYLKQHNLHFEEGYIYEDILWSVDLWGTQPRSHKIDYIGYEWRLNPTSTTSQQRDTRPVFRLLRQRLHGAATRQKLIILYTMVRLWAHFILHKQ